MRKLIVFGVLLLLSELPLLSDAPVFFFPHSIDAAARASNSGSENPYEKMVQDFCGAAQKFFSALGMCRIELLWRLHMYQGASFLLDSADGDMHDTRAFFAALTKTKDPVKTKVVKTIDLKDEDVQGALIAATCGDVTIYFAVGRNGKNEAEKEMRIGAIFEKEEIEDKIRQIEKKEKMEREAVRTMRGRGGFNSYVQTAKVEAARLLIRNVELALQVYNMKHGGIYPYSLDALTEASDDNSEPLLEGDLVDPWGNELRYEKRGKKRPVIRSAGPDGEFGTDDDLMNYNPFQSRESRADKVAGFTEAISEEEGSKAKSAVNELDERTIKRLGE